jgi:hypothetical protein
MWKRIMLLALSLQVFSPHTQAAENQFISERGLYSVSYESQLEPIAINRMHSWMLTVTDSSGMPITGAVIVIKGGMPQHNHGLATQPTVESSGEGTYLLQGLRFHMMGYWEIELIIDNGRAKDTVMIPLTL